MATSFPLGKLTTNFDRAQSPSYVPPKCWVITKVKKPRYPDELDVIIRQEGCHPFRTLLLPGTLICFVPDLSAGTLIPKGRQILTNPFKLGDLNAALVPSIRPPVPLLPCVSIQNVSIIGVDLSVSVSESLLFDASPSVSEL
ncbi:hypothetical protein JAAARDRAFT_37300 [Jaapia argillacea MUCL 33604]|uniref:Uncharacterized protein n=1 Tax=Jaapia argillacea MUCL 33604 TaxID=933084 RepID=A0A067PPY6_9AGAM|nr:hypothetical protein JAAARDRAFT_37300 [Jaapia argillacea MUCL 33604]